jgi:hypothetical protein
MCRLPQIGQRAIVSRRAYASTGKNPRHTGPVSKRKKKNRRRTYRANFDDTLKYFRNHMNLQLFNHFIRDGAAPSTNALGAPRPI